MKKVSTITIILCGLFLFAGFSQAAPDANLLQPASDITYNENLIVNGYGQFASIRIGAEGIGGVTYFNGTIVNIGENIPVTFGDDVRIDGMIWGGPNKGNATDQALKIADTLLPALTDINDIGSKNYQWRNLHLSGMLHGGDVNLSGTLEGNDINLDGTLTGNNINLTGKLDVVNIVYSNMLSGKNMNLTGKLDGKEAKFTGNVEVGNLLGAGVINSNNILDSSIQGQDIKDQTIQGNHINTSADLNISQLYAQDGIITNGDILVTGKVDGVDISNENSIWYSTLAGDTLADPLSNPYPSRMAIGKGVVACDTTNGGMLQVSLPFSYSNTGSYIINATGGSSTSNPHFSSIGVINTNANAFSILVECDGGDVSSEIHWTTIGF